MGILWHFESPSCLLQIDRRRRQGSPILRPKRDCPKGFSLHTFMVVFGADYSKTHLFMSILFFLIPLVLLVASLLEVLCLMVVTIGTLWLTAVTSC